MQAENDVDAHHIPLSKPRFLNLQHAPDSQNEFFSPPISLHNLTSAKAAMFCMQSSLCVMDTGY